MHIAKRLLSLLLVLISVRATVAQGPTTFAERDPRYRLQSSDVLEIHYRYTPEFDQTVTVQPDGFATLQIVGDIKLQGLTLEQANAALTKQDSLRLKDPEVTLILKEFEKPYFVVAGEVGLPGRYEMRGSVTAVQAIAMAGGFRNSSKHSQVLLFRRAGADLAKTEILDLKEAMRAPGSEHNIDLQPGDVLIVPQNVVSKIERYIKWGNFGAYINPLTR